MNPSDIAWGLLALLSLIGIVYIFAGLFRSFFP